MKVHSPSEFISVQRLKGMFHPANSQTRDDAARVALQDSLERNGLLGRGIVVNKRNQKIVGGHGTVDACIDIGYAGELPVVWVDLSEDEHVRLMIQLNTAQGRQDQDLLSAALTFLVQHGHEEINLRASLNLPAGAEEIMRNNARTSPVTESPFGGGFDGGGFDGGEGPGERRTPGLTCPECGYSFRSSRR